MNNPPIGANMWIWDSPVTTEVIRQRAPQAKAMGFDMVELPIENAQDWEAGEVRRILEDTGLQAGVCAAMGPGRDLTSLDPQVVKSTQEYIRACVHYAAEIGATVVVGPMYSPTGQTGPIEFFERERIFQTLVGNLTELVAHAEVSGVRLAIEPLNRFETSLFNTVEQTMPLIEMIDHPSLGLLLDTFHMNIEERDIGAAIRRAGKHLVHFHACGNDRGAPGNDGIDWTAVRDALKEIGYTGAVSIESFTSANKTIATAASIWRPLAETQDALASDGLTFLRELFAGS
jgi:D-psicose/D-tagatose/L-ribulose 3-epimerase